MNEEEEQLQLLVLVWNSVDGVRGKVNLVHQNIFTMVEVTVALVVWDNGYRVIGTVIVSIDTDKCNNGGLHYSLL